ncbi:LysR family transcriptional regulator [Acidimangrovimonas sediminis]|uniref:LysR family transcriptional regulator n=1 Tax=Acidimangrovimonas sediminis TaxID=2056283 RepID=UPI000C80EF5F|nr:LysR family transcriptional regulator [Acidimangrovimonas sediminis]
MALELRHWRAFATAAGTLHFGLAAEQLGISQSALSQLIKTVESHLGAALFDRARQRVELTEAGRRLLPEARAVLDQASRAEQTGLVAGRALNRALQVGYVGSAAIHPRFTALMAAISACRPAISLRLDQCSVTDQTHLLIERQMDIGLLRAPDPSVPPEIAFLTLARDHMVAALPAAHELAAGEAPLDLAALADSPFIEFRRQQSGGLNLLVRDACAAAGFTPRQGQTVPQIATMLCLVGAGLGVALVPASAQRLGVAGVAFRSLVQPVHADLRMMYRRSDTAPALRDALRLARAES